MATFVPTKKLYTDFNGGNKYISGDGVQPSTLNNLIESQLYTQEMVENAPNGYSIRLTKSQLDNYAISGSATTTSLSNISNPLGIKIGDVVLDNFKTEYAFFMSYWQVTEVSGGIVYLQAIDYYPTVDIAQTTGTSKFAVMSQKSITRLTTDLSVYGSIPQNYKMYGYSSIIGGSATINTNTKRAHDDILHLSNGKIEIAILDKRYQISLLLLDSNQNVQYDTSWIEGNMGFETDLPYFLVNIKKNDDTEFSNDDVENIYNCIKIKVGVHAIVSSGKIIPTNWTIGGWSTSLQVGVMPSTTTSGNRRRSVTFYPTGKNILVEYIEQNPTYNVALMLADENGIVWEDTGWITTNKIIKNSYSNVYITLKKVDGSNFTEAETYNLNKYFKIKVTEAFDVAEPFVQDVITFTNHKNYESWAKNLYDYENQRLLTVYASGKDHAYNEKSIYIAEYKDGSLTYHLVADGGAASIKPMGIIKRNNMYIILATWGETWVDGVSKILRYTSKDLLNWEVEEVNFPWSTVATGAINIDNIHIINGRLFTNLTYYDVPVMYVCYSDDYGITWHITNAVSTNQYVASESVFFKIKDRIIMLARKGITGDRNTAFPLWFSYSTDNGVTWSAPRDTTGIVDANNSNLSVVRYGQDKVIVLFGTRRSGTAGIYCSITDIEKAYNGEFEIPIKLNNGIASSDFGYPNIARTPNGFYYTYYTSGSLENTTTASIYLCKLNYLNPEDKEKDLTNMLADVSSQS